MKKNIFILLFISLILPSSVIARQQSGFSLIRDAEIEKTIEMITLPILQAAKIDPAAFRFYLVNDKAVNAFAGGGQNVFLHTGLIQKTTHPNQLIGVIAHEIGHIAGGHLTRIDEGINSSYRAGILGLLIGAAASIAAKDPTGLMVGGIGGMSMMERNFMRFTRTQESSADQAALLFLKQAKQSPQGLMELFNILKGQSVISVGFQDPYLRTHPFVAERIESIADAVKHSNFKQSDTPKQWVDAHQRMIAKLDGFLESPVYVLRKYKINNGKNININYLARAIAYHRRHEHIKALSEIDKLLQTSPKDPYYHELKGQILFEYGKINQALTCYQQAFELLSNNALIRVSLAQSLLSVNNKKFNKQAINHLEYASQKEPDNSQAWYFLSIAYGREGKMAEAAYALAEKNAALHNFDDALEQIRRAESLLPAGAVLRRKLQDIKHEIEYIKKRNG